MTCSRVGRSASILYVAVSSETIIFHREHRMHLPELARHVHATACKLACYLHALCTKWRAVVSTCMYPCTQLQTNEAEKGLDLFFLKNIDLQPPRHLENPCNSRGFDQFRRKNGRIIDAFCLPIFFKDPYRSPFQLR